MNSLARGIELLRAFLGNRGHRIAAQISKHGELSRVVTHRCSYTLSAASYVTKTGKHHKLEAKSAQPGTTVLHRRQLITRHRATFSGTGQPTDQRIVFSSRNGWR